MYLHLTFSGNAGLPGVREDNYIPNWMIISLSDIHILAPTSALDNGLQSL